MAAIIYFDTIFKKNVQDSFRFFKKGKNKNFIVGCWWALTPQAALH